MSDETVLTPIKPEEEISAPPKIAPSAMAAAPSSPTVKLKPIIRKPLIRKPVIGGVKPVSLKPAVGTPPPPAAVPEAAATVANPDEPQLKPVASPLAAQATLRKTGVVAEGILTPAQAQAAKTKTSRISLESAIGVAPSVKSSAPMKTIRLRRPTDIPPAPVPPASVAAAPALSPVKPEAPVSPAPEAAPPAVSESASAPADMPAPEAGAADATAAAVAPANEPSTTVTQKKTLKLRRPNFKRPTVGGLRKPGATSPSTVADTAAPAPVAETGDAVADIPDIDDIPDIKPLPSAAAGSVADDSETVAGVPAWLNAMTLAVGIAALVVIGLCTWSLFCQAVGPDAGPNGLASFYSETDRSR